MGEKGLDYYTCRNYFDKVCLGCKYNPLENPNCDRYVPCHVVPGTRTAIIFYPDDAANIRNHLRDLIRQLRVVVPQVQSQRQIPEMGIVIALA